MDRKFISVGHGGFSKEWFTDKEGNVLFTIVYDCGSYRKTEVQEKIKKNTQENEIIDILFLSHFDRDHINGVEDLLDRCTVKKLMIPIFNDEVLLTEYLVAKTKYPFGTIATASTTTVAFIKGVITGYFGNFGKFDNINIEYVPTTGSSTTRLKIHTSGNPMEANEIPFWEYIPFNLPFDETRYKEFFNWFKGQHQECFDGDNLDMDKIDRALTNKDVYKQVKSHIKSILGDTNDHSMVLYSGPVEEKKAKLLASCLYMGDFKATGAHIKNLANALTQKRWKQIHMVQVPHHGSKYNFNINSGLYDNGVIGVIFASENETNYPAIEVKQEIINNGGIPIKVSYSEYTELLFHFDL